MPEVRGFLRRRLVDPLLALLRQGVDPSRLALGVALAFVIGVVPVLGVSTALCAAVALAFGLNLPAMQVVNYLLTPVQLILIIPWLRFGELLANAPRFPITLESGLALLSQGVVDAVVVLGTAILHATLGWIVVAPLLAFALHRILVPVFRHMTPARPSETR